MTLTKAGLILLALALSACGDFLVPNCEETSTNLTCQNVNGVWTCPRGDVCNDGEVHPSCTDHGGTYCYIR